MTQATGSSFFTQAMALATANTASTALPELLAFMTSRLGQQRANTLVQKVGHLLTLEQEYALKETYLYGSSRLGVKNQNTILSTRVASVQNGSLTPIGNAILNNDSVFTGTASAYNLPKAPSSRVFYRTWGLKQYELSNHLGNVQVTISDKKLGVVGSNQVDFIAYEPEVKSATDYYAGGMEMPGKSYQSTAYRYGMNTQEKDNEIYGPGNTLGALYWEYDARIARRWNVDPVVKEYEGAYTTFSGNPIWFVDPAGSDTEVVNSAGERLECIPSPQVDGKDHKIVQLKEISISFERETTSDKIKETFFAGLGVVGGVSEALIGAGIGAASSGVSSVLSGYLAVDGFVRAASSLSKIGIIWGKDVTDNSSQIHKKNLIESIPSSIPNFTGKVLDKSFETKDKRFEKSISFAGDIATFSAAGGTGAFYKKMLLEGKPALGATEFLLWSLEFRKSINDLKEQK